MKKIFTLVLFALILACKSSSNLYLSQDGFIDVSKVGIKPNGKDQSEEIQFVLDKYRGIGKFYFPKGNYVFETLHIYEGLQLKGTKDTWFIRPANCGKYSRMLNSIKYLHNSDKDSKPIVLSNLNFDGSADKQGPYDKHQLEQQAMIFLAADNKKAGRQIVKISDCYFENGVGDAITVYYNVDLEVNDIVAKNVFRGAITATGGYTKIIADGMKTIGDKYSTGFDIELDAFGYGKTKDIDVVFRNMVLDGGMDVGMIGGSFLGENIELLGPPFTIYGPKTKIVFKNSKFHNSDIRRGRIFFPENVLFKKCDFFIQSNNKEPKNLGAISVYMNTSYRTSNHMRLNFDECNFYLDDKLENKNVTGIKIYPDDEELDNLITLNSCKFSGPYTNNIYFNQGGSITADNITLDGKNGIVLNSALSKRSYYYSAKFKNVKSPTDSTLLVRYKDDENNKIKFDSKISRLEPILGKSKTKIEKR